MRVISIAQAFFFSIVITKWWFAAAASQKTHHPVVLAINAANTPIDWPNVKSFSYMTDMDWSVEQLHLEEFGTTMKERGFQAALEQSNEAISKALTLHTPDALLVTSKGVGIITYLASKGLWDGPTVLLSPIPNECDHIEGGSWESEWKSTMSVLSRITGPVTVGVGTSQDEQSFIVDMMEETGVCGRIKVRQREGAVTTILFEKCRSMVLGSFPGGHSWKNDPSNAPFVAWLIDTVFDMHKHHAKKRQGVDGTDGSSCANPKTI